MTINRGFQEKKKEKKKRLKKGMEKRKRKRKTGKKRKSRELANGAQSGRTSPSNPPITQQGGGHNPESDRNCENSLTLWVLSTLTSIFLRVSWSSRSMMISEAPPKRKFILSKRKGEREKKKEN